MIGVNKSEICIIVSTGSKKVWFRRLYGKHTIYMMKNVYDLDLIGNRKNGYVGDVTNKTR